MLGCGIFLCLVIAFGYVCLRHSSMLGYGIRLRLVTAFVSVRPPSDFRFFEEGSALRTQLIAFASGSERLEAYPFLYTELRSYALIPLVGRQVERVHADLKQVSKKKSHIAVPMASCLIRRDEVLAVMDNGDFRSFVRSAWRQRDWTRRHLSLNYPCAKRWRIKLLGPVLTRSTWYQCSIASQFRDHSEQKRVAVEWSKIAKPILQPTVLPMSSEDRLLVEFMRAKFEQPRRVWSIPRMHVPGDPAFVPSAGAEGLPICAALAQSLEAAVEPINQEVGTLFFFRIVSARPDAKRMLPIPHLIKSKGRVVVETCQLDGVRDGVVSLSMHGRERRELDLCAMCNMKVLSQLLCWGEEQLDSSITLALPAAASLGAIGALQAQALGPVPGVSGEAALVPLANSTKKGAQSQILSCLLDSGCTVDDGEYMPCMQVLERCPNASVDIADLLVASGTLVAQQDEFGEVAIAVDRSQLALDWSSRLASPDPILLLPVSDLSPHSSKIDMVLALLRDGWVAERRAPPLYADGADKRFAESMVHRSSLYFLCLLKAPDIFARGCPAIAHAMPHSYYMALWTMKDLTLLCARPDLYELKDADFKLIMKGTHVPDKLALHDGGVADTLVAEDDGDVDDGDDLGQALAVLEHAPGPVEIPACALGLRDAVAEWAIPVRFGAAVARFDLFSHASGIQRGYISCRFHQPCHKYTQVNRWPSKHALCAYLFAWEQLGEELTIEQHKARDCVPPQAAIDRIMAALQP